MLLRARQRRQMRRDVFLADDERQCVPLRTGSISVTVTALTLPLLVSCDSWLGDLAPEFMSLQRSDSSGVSFVELFRQGWRISVSSLVLSLPSLLSPASHYFPLPSLHQGTPTTVFSGAEAPASALLPPRNGSGLVGTF